MFAIREIDPTDHAALKEFWEVEYRANLAGHPHGITRSWGVMQSSIEPSAYYAHRYLTAERDGVVVGTADLGYGLQDNLHIASVAIAVSSTSRRQGVGRALHEACAAIARELARTTLLAEVNLTEESQESLAFGQSMGFETVHTEDHLYCELPMPADKRAELEARCGEQADDYEVVTWVDHCPEEFAVDYCELHTQMSADVPIGEIAFEPVIYDVARLRATEARIARAYTQIVAATRRRSDGVFGGYSIVVLDPSEDYVHQDDTLVMPEHRGHLLGLRLKLATLDLVERDHPERTSIHTWTAVDNAPMQRINRAFGYTPVERAHELQITLAGGPRRPTTRNG